MGLAVVPLQETNNGLAVVLPGAGMKVLVAVVSDDIVPVPDAAFCGNCTVKVVLRVPAVIAGVLLTATAYIPGNTVLGPPVPAGEQTEARNVPGNSTVARPFPPCVVMVTISQNGPPAPEGAATFTRTAYEPEADPPFAAEIWTDNCTELKTLTGDGGDDSRRNRLDFEGWGRLRESGRDE